jgi:hypothetical protein
MTVTPYERKKQRERWILETARAIYPFFPPGEIELFEGPDLRIKTDTGWLGVEIVDIVRPKGAASSRPVEAESFHCKVVRLAEKIYYSRRDAKAVCVGVAFLDDEQCKRENLDGWRRLVDGKSGSKLQKMGNSLVEFVSRHPVPATGSAIFSEREMPGQAGPDTLPTGIEVISISLPPGPWHYGESSVSLTALDPQHVCALLRKKGQLLPDYRAKMPGAPTWLLFYSGLQVSRGVPIPPNIADWKFAFGFDKVLLFSAMDNRVFEIGRQ